MRGGDARYTVCMQSDAPPADPARDPAGRAAIAIVGAGLGGLTAARRLADAGRAVVLFEKSRGLGGRLATRRVDADGSACGPFDHGAPAAHGLGAAACAVAAVRWPAGDIDGRLAHCGLPGMSGLVGPLAAGLVIRQGATVAALLRVDGGWRATLDDGTVAGLFAAVVLAIPAPQAAALARAHLDGARFDAVVMTPCWTVLAAWQSVASAPTAAPPHPFAEVVRERDKPGRWPVADAWVAHATPDWSRAALERDRADVARELLPILARHLGRSDAPLYSAAHRWRYARTDRPLGAPFLAAPDGTLLAGGDWALGPWAGDAVASGTAMADALLAWT